MSRSLCFNTSTEQVCLQVTSLSDEVLQSQVLRQRLLVPLDIANVATFAERQLLAQISRQYLQLYQQGVQQNNLELQALADRFNGIISTINDRIN